MSFLSTIKPVVVESRHVAKRVNRCGLQVVIRINQRLNPGARWICHFDETVQQIVAVCGSIPAPIRLGSLVSGRIVGDRGGLSERVPHRGDSREPVVGESCGVAAFVGDVDRVAEDVKSCAAGDGFCAADTLLAGVC